MPQLTNTEHRRQVYATLASAGMRDKADQKDMIRQYTNQRTDSSHEMYAHEAIQLIQDLKKKPGSSAADKMRKKLLHYAHLIGWKDPATGKADMKSVDTWCKDYGKFHKSLMEHSVEELPQLISQFEKVFKSYLTHI